jgi:predicted nucleotidyltransferase
LIKSEQNIFERHLNRYNEALAKNRDLRLSIDDLRKERNVYMDINNKLHKELKKKKKELEKELKEAEDIYMKKE